MDETLMALIRRELVAFRQRGGDDLEARYVERVDDDPAVELHRRSDGRKHSVYVHDGKSAYIPNVVEYGVYQVLGITCAHEEEVVPGSVNHSQTPEGQRAFVRELGRFLDANRGRFEPIRETNVAISSNASDILRIVQAAMPEDGSISIWGNVDPDPADLEDEFTFSTSVGDPLDFRLRTVPGGVDAYDRSGRTATFLREDGFAGLEEAVRNSLAASAGLTP